MVLEEDGDNEIVEVEEEYEQAVFQTAPEEEVTPKAGWPKGWKELKGDR